MDHQQTQQIQAPENRLVRFSNLCMACFTWFGDRFYTTYHLLAAQVLVTFVAAQMCAWMTRDKSLGLKFALTLAVILSAFYLILFLVAVQFMDVIRTWFETWVASYQVYFDLGKALLIVALIRVFVFAATALENEVDLDGYSAGFFLLSYLNIVSLCKLFRMEDYICLSDSILGIAILVAARLDHYGGTTEFSLHDIAQAPASHTSDHATFVGRAVAIYASAFLMVCFRFSRIPPLAPPAAADIENPAIVDNDGTGAGAIQLAVVPPTPAGNGNEMRNSDKDDDLLMMLSNANANASSGAAVSDLGMNPDGSALNPAAFQQHIRGDSNLMGQLVQNDPELAQVVSEKDIPSRFLDEGSILNEASGSGSNNAVANPTSQPPKKHNTSEGSPVKQ